MIKTIKKKTTTKKAAEKVKTAIDDSEKVRPMTYDEACTRVMELQSENDALKNECEKLTAGCQDLSDANQRLNKTCNDILAEKSQIEEEFKKLKNDNNILMLNNKQNLEILNSKTNQLDFATDLASKYMKEKNKYRQYFFILFAIVFTVYCAEILWRFGTNIQLLIEQILGSK